MCKALRQSATTYYTVDGSTLLLVFEKGKYKRGEFNKSMSKYLYAPTEMGQAKHKFFLYIYKKGKFKIP